MNFKLAVCVCVGLILLFAPAATSQNEPNICWTTHVGHCYSDVEWYAGWFWAKYPPSLSSCISYHSIFSMGDFWGMCNGIDLPDDTPVAQPPNVDSGGASGSGNDQTAALTSQWHALPGNSSDPCPVEGLDPIINYEDGTYICGTSF